MSPRAGLPRRVVWRTGRILRFAGFFTVRLVQANLVVAREILTPGHALCPAIVRVPLRAGTDTEVAAMALAVSLTPGTLTVGVHRDPPALSVHGMHAGDAETFRRQLAELEGYLLAALRPVGGAHPIGGANRNGGER
ncbi:multicomponent Na+:H+ antiporter subunit E [Micromonospora nigra]|uniref:Multicomponent Na+:H+ antiporter subunit E n=1 Tax=Micromonospora nigra TaxID=145857 RepID=A0A1C6RGA7_9ACTN|nr:Na+/H+ antiporter subunit E [Micromonospora nigra]SCL16082.1 multicomponent Na+:H+ antiporter subunit E [Micromonospora nigra]